MNIDIFKHQLCTDFRELYVMPDSEAERFHEGFAHFHNVMTEINEQPLQNALWLQDNYLTLWNENTPKEMLNKVVEYSVKTAMEKQDKVSFDESYQDTKDS